MHFVFRVHSKTEYKKYTIVVLYPVQGADFHLRTTGPVRIPEGKLELTLTPQSGDQFVVDAVVEVDLKLAVNALT